MLQVQAGRGREGLRMHTFSARDDTAPPLEHSRAASPPPAYRTPVITETAKTEEEEVFAGVLLRLAVGTLGLVEMVVFIVYSWGGYAPLYALEELIFRTFAGFEAVGYVLVIIYSLAYMAHFTYAVDRPANIENLLKDPFHNMVYPSYPPASATKRAELTGIAWYGVCLACVPVLLLLALFQAQVARDYDEPLLVRTLAPLVAILTICTAVMGSLHISSSAYHNASACALAFMYATGKGMSLFVLVYSPKRLLWAQGGTVVGMVLGLSLLFLQLVKIASVYFAAVGYMMGRPDEKHPKFKDLCKNVLLSHIETGSDAQAAEPANLHQTDIVSTRGGPVLS